MRYLTKNISDDLKKKMVFLSGPRQSGKTTLAKAIISQTGGLYYNWDIRSHQKIIRDSAWDKSVPLVVFDELHKYSSWKNYLKGIFDEYAKAQSFLITESARLDTFRKSGDALTGRYYHYRLHPLDVSEALHLFNTSYSFTAHECIEHLMRYGGFPEAYLNPSDAERLRNNRFDLVIQEDLRDLSRVNSIRDFSLLIELLRERVGSTLNFDNLAGDLNVSAPTIKAWIELLERLYVIFRVYPFTRLSRSIKKESKAYFFDCAAAYNGPGACLENCVAASLIKFLHYIEYTRGVKSRLCFYRDREKREVDFVVEINRQIEWIIEVKTDDDSLHKNLVYLKDRIRCKEAIQLVKNISSSKEIQGVKIINAAEWLSRLFDGES